MRKPTDLNLAADLAAHGCLLLWRCPRCDHSYLHARFLVTHLIDAHGEMDGFGRRP